MKRRVCLAVAACVALAGAGARADDAREGSRAAFKRGVEELKRGDYARARGSFLEAHKLYPHPSILLNLALARSKTGEWVEAERDLGRFVAEDAGASPDEIATARHLMSDVRKHVGTLRVRAVPASATVTVDGQPVALVPGVFVDVRVSEGVHALRAEAPAHKPTEQRVLAAGERSLDCDLRLVPVQAAVEVTDDRRTPRTLGFVLLGVSALSLGLGIWSGLRAQSLADDYNTPGNAGFQSADTRSEGVLHRTTADVAFVVALISAGVGAYLVFDPFGKRAAQLGLSPTGATLRGAF
jgi:hypothetical protein